MSTALTWGAVPGLCRDRSGTANRTRPTITLRVVNEATIDHRSLLLAEEEAVRVLDHSGINLVWLDCEAGRADWASANGCNLERGPAEFWVYIVTRKPAATSGEMLGFTELDEATGYGSAGIYCPAAAAMARQWQARVGDILGVAVAHEVGHLLGIKAHSLSGVMNAHWAREQFDLINISELNFTAGQAKLLQNEISRRTSGSAESLESTVQEDGNCATGQINGSPESGPRRARPLGRLTTSETLRPHDARLGKSQVTSIADPGPMTNVPTC